MAKSMRNDKRKHTKLVATRTALVQAALDAGKVSRREICQATGLQRHELTNLFTDNREIFAAYTVRRKTITEAAADNIQEIVNDKNHPQNFAASKFVLQTYKSELEDILEPMAGEMQIEVPSGTGDDAQPVIIKFSSPKKE